MKTATIPAIERSQSIHMLPGWITRSGAETVETLAFSSGAALAILDVMLREPNGAVPGTLLRDRMALNAAVACLKLENRREVTSDIRDAVCLARAGDALGPAGDMFMAWRKLAHVNLTSSGWQKQIHKVLPGPAVEMMQASKAQSGSPVAQATQVLTYVLRAFPRQEAAALMLADATLARAAGWGQVMPLLALQLPRKDIRAISDGNGNPAFYVHRAMVAACDTVIRSAADLGRRASKLRTIAPKLRAKGSDEALALFLSHDAVSPSGMLSPVIKGTSAKMTDRAARRLCDRLVDLGVVRELTGRLTFRLYGV